MKVLRTPDDRFCALPDFPYEPHYVTIMADDGTDLRIAYIDEGDPKAAPVLLMHGEPSWSFLYRAMIARLVASGHRVIAPDLIGFGRSDKPSEQADYTYERHVAWMSSWLTALDLKNVTLFCQDWGGLIGLRLVAALSDRFARVAAGNTGLPIGTGWTEGFRAWRDFSQRVDVFPTSFILNGGTARDLSAAELAAYDAPYPDETYKAGARVFPTLVPVTPEHGSVAENIVAWKVLEQFEKPFLTCFSDMDAVTRGGEKLFQKKIPGARGQKHIIIANAGHFLQEDQPEQLADLIDMFVRG